MEWYAEVLSKYGVFTGRARRKEYWMFTLFNILAACAIIIVQVILNAMTSHQSNALIVLYDIGVFLPSLAVSVRRMHDTDHSGWWILFPLVNLFFLLLAGDAGENRFGEDPKGYSPA